MSHIVFFLFLHQDCIKKQEYITFPNTVFQTLPAKKACVTLSGTKFCTSKD